MFYRHKKEEFERENPSATEIVDKILLVFRPILFPTV